MYFMHSLRYNCCIATYLMEITMFDFEKQYKETLEKFEIMTKQTKDAYEFWYNCVMDTWKDLYSKKK